MKSINGKLYSIFSLLPFLVFGLYPLIPERQENLTVIVFVISSLIIFSKPKNIHVNKYLIITTSLFFIFLVSAILSENWTKGFKKIETMTSLVVIPFCFYFLLEKSNLNYDKLKTRFYKIYFTANIIFCFLCINIFNNYVNPRYPNKDSNFFRMALSDNPIIGDHPTYISIFLSIAIIFGFSFLQNKREKLLYNVLIVLGQFFFLVILITLMSKGVILAFIISSLAYILYNSKSKRLIVVPILIVVSLILLIYIPSQNNRFNQLFESESYKTLNYNNSTTIRLNILNCNMALALKKPIFGYGLGNVQEELDKCYKKNLLDLERGKYNSHNQYFFLWLTSGIIGLFVFLYLLFFYFKIAIKFKDKLMLSILIFYLVVFLFENVLSRQSGVIFFSFILNFLVKANLNKQNKVIL